MKLTITQAPNDIDHVTFHSEENDPYHRQLTSLSIAITGSTTREKIAGILKGIHDCSKDKKKYGPNIRFDSLRALKELLEERIKKQQSLFGDTDTSQLRLNLETVNTEHRNAFSIDGVFV